MGENPGQEVPFFEDPFPNIVAGALVFRISWIPSSLSDGCDHVARFLDANDRIPVPVEDPDGQVRNQRGSGDVTPSADRNRRSEHVRVFENHGPGSVAAHGLARNIQAPGIDAEFSLERMDNFHNKLELSCRLPGVGLDPRITLRGQNKAGIPGLIFRPGPEMRAESIGF